MILLTMAKPGEQNFIKEIGGDAEIRQHIENLGLVVGSPLTLISTIAGNVIVNVKESRIAISKEMASKIILKEKKLNMRTLKTVNCGDTVRVAKISCEGASKRRIVDMGITKGVEIFVRKIAPLGDLIEVTVRGYELSLQKSDAEMIAVY